jgi:hypothetical protein
MKYVTRLVSEGQLVLLILKTKEKNAKQMTERFI